jgi:hypothetical protein
LQQLLGAGEQRGYMAFTNAVPVTALLSSTNLPGFIGFRIDHSFPREEAICIRFCYRYPRHQSSPTVCDNKKSTCFKQVDY